MKRSEIRNQAYQRISAGKSKQQTFDELAVTPGISQHILANVVRHIPSLESRKKYRALGQVFIFYLGLMIIQLIFRIVNLGLENGFRWVYLVALIPIGIYVILIWGVGTFNGYSYKYSAIWLTLQFLVFLINSLANSFTLVNLLVLVFLAAGIGLGFFLYFRLCPNYQVFQEESQDFRGEKEMRRVIKFKD